MSGGGGHIIVGDKPLVDQLIAYAQFVAVFRLEHMLDIIGKYRKNENSLTRDDQQFLLRCAADIVDHP
jgi:hypothetical protein